MTHRILNVALTVAILLTIGVPVFAQSTSAAVQFITFGANAVQKPATLRGYLETHAVRLIQAAPSASHENNSWASRNAPVVGALIGGGIGASVGFILGGQDYVVGRGFSPMLGGLIGAAVGAVIGTLSK